MHAGHALQIADQSGRIWSGDRDGKAGNGGHLGLEGFKDARFGLLAKAGNATDAPLARGTGEVFHRFHVQFVPKGFDPLGAEARHFEQFGQGRRGLLFQFLQKGAMARGDHLNDLPGQILADARQFLEVVTRLHHGMEIGTHALYEAGGVAVGPDPERVGIVDFQKIGDFIEGARDIRIEDRHGLWVLRPLPGW